jgi:transcriptional regulator with XRE-family HTH domain
MIESADSGNEERAPLAERTRGIRRRIGHRIAERRRELGWSQEELADRLAIPRGRLGKWENGYNAPPPEDLVGLSEILGLTADELLTGEKPRRELSPEACAQITQHLAAILGLLQ